MGPASLAGTSPVSAWLVQLSAVQPEKMKHHISLGVTWCLHFSWLFPRPGETLPLFFGIAS